LNQENFIKDPAETANMVMINPLEDSAWDSKITTMPEATCFHSSGWARVLHDSYGYTPCFLATRRSDGLIGSVLPLMEVSSLLTGRRGISLPFTDYCDPTASHGREAELLVEAALLHARERRWRYVEFRASMGIPQQAPASVRYLAHQLDLRPGEDEIWAGLNGATRRSVRKARAYGVKVFTDASDAAVREYYRLHCLTRKRLGVPPQPRGFFSHLRRHLVERDLATVFLASHCGRTIAAAIFMHFGGRVIFKFGASDIAFQHLRANNLLMWEAIRHFAAQGMRDLHMGRNEIGNHGLRRYKLGWGTTESELAYHRYVPARGKFVTDGNPQRSWHHATFRSLPLPVSKIIGSWVYAHMA